MKLYYHKTDGGAEYYCLTPVEGTSEGNMATAIIRTDGGEIEVIMRNIKRYDVPLIIEGDK